MNYYDEIKNKLITKNNIEVKNENILHGLIIEDISSFMKN